MGTNNLLTFFWLTVRMLVWQPMVFGILEFKVGVAELALLGSEVFKMLRAVVSVAQLILVVYSWAVLAAVGGPGVRKQMNIREADQTVSVSLKQGNKSCSQSAERIEKDDLASLEPRRLSLIIFKNSA